MRQIIRIYVGLGLAAILLSVTATQADSPKQLPPDFDALVAEVLKTFEIPGMGIAVVKDGKVLLAKGYGERKLGGKATTPKTRFPIASNSKAFTATALAILVDNGRIAWDTPVVEYLPDFALSDPYVTANLTVRDLLAHNSGLPLGAGDLLWWPQTTHTMDEAIRRLRYIPLASSFRQKYAYDNVLYGVAGKLVETVSGISFSDFVTRRILKPAGMKDALMQFKGADTRGNVARAHAKIDGELQLIDAFISEKTNAAGGLQTSARDMARWLRIQLADGVIDEDKRLFSQDSATALTSIVTPMSVSPPPCGIKPLGSQFAGYALGFRVADYRGRRIVGHGGGLPGFISDVFMMPEHNLGIVIMTNQQVRAGITVLRSVLLDHFLGVDDTDWLPVVQACHEEQLAKYAAMKDSVKSERELGTSALPDARLIGKYRDAWYGDMEIRKTKGGKLELDFMHTPALVGAMEHWHHNTWLVRWYAAPLPPNNAFITFSLNAKGQVVSTTMEPESPFTDFSYDFKDLNFKPVP